MFASRKKQVIGIDVNSHAVDTINSGNIHIVEPDLDIVVRAAVTQKYLRASLIPEASDAFLIAVPTPFKDDKQPDLSYIEAACKAIAPVLQKGNVLVLESTSPVGATKQMAQWIAELRPDLSLPSGVDSTEQDLFIAHCPERVLPGHVMRELVENDRVIGGLSKACAEKAKALYQIFVEGECVLTDCDTAEMAKLTENAFRDVNIAFANELSIICDELGINVWELIAIANRHPRVNILQPGPGVGGHCIAVDPWFIVSRTPELASLIATARKVNDGKPEWVLDKVNAALVEVANVKGVAPSQLSIACLGLAFKPDIDDLRESPALQITKTLSERHTGQILAVEPNIHELPAKLSAGNIRLVDEYTAVKEADIVLLLVDHKQFKSMPLQLSDTQRLVDTRGVWN
ncbi:UDP-N-acetyl-D-mannosamine dehydrogenase [Paraneptunicella aestuarii]|uniref:UDP-N-acetyl-D-mannosamine dehydrogenase n=1 Tax=Paraneptunicella aestuarii TaxID=2831148 RepID=UPI0022B6FEA1|nr:UDP-N-acetyl-D-mannosamine dehydrogenase [Paraneptunicella aestuarii]